MECPECSLTFNDNEFQNLIRVGLNHTLVAYHDECRAKFADCAVCLSKRSLPADCTCLCCGSSAKPLPGPLESVADFDACGAVTMNQMSLVKIEFLAQHISPYWERVTTLYGKEPEHLKATLTCGASPLEIARKLMYNLYNNAESVDKFRTVLRLVK